MGNVWDAMKKHEHEQKHEQKQEQKQKQVQAKEVSPKNTADANMEPSPPDSKEYGLTCASSDGYSPLLVVHHDRGGTFAEQYRSLRTNMLARAQQDYLCTAITSAETGEGKTITCLNLAFALAELPGIRVVVIDGDLRKGTLTSLLNVERTPGFADLLRGDCSLEEVIRPTLYANIDVIPCGAAKRNELGTVLGKFQKSGIIAKLRQQYDCVLADTPAISMTSDACVLAPVLGEVLLVVRMHKTNRESVQRAVGLLNAADVKISGMFLTHQKSYVPTYFNRYY